MLFFIKFGLNELFDAIKLGWNVEKCIFPPKWQMIPSKLFCIFSRIKDHYNNYKQITSFISPFHFSF